MWSNSGLTLSAAPLLCSHLHPAPFQPPKRAEVDDDCVPAVVEAEIAIATTLDEVESVQPAGGASAKGRLACCLALLLPSLVDEENTLIASVVAPE